MEERRREAAGDKYKTQIHEYVDEIVLATDIVATVAHQLPNSELHKEQNVKKVRSYTCCLSLLRASCNPSIFSNPLSLVVLRVAGFPSL